MAQIDDLRERFAQPFGDECVLWEGSQGGRGYGRVRLGGRSAGREYVHRLACRVANGDAPEGRPFAGHECGRSLCYNPRHLYWCSQEENEADKHRHGTVQAKLCESDVREIFGLRDSDLSAGQVGRLWAVNRSTVSSIWLGKSWRHLGLVEPFVRVEYEDF